MRGSIFSQSPKDLDRKSGIPEGVEIPAPVSATVFFAEVMSFALSSSNLMETEAVTDAVSLLTCADAKLRYPRVFSLDLRPGYPDGKERGGFHFERLDELVLKQVK